MEKCRRYVTGAKIAVNQYDLQPVHDKPKDLKYLLATLLVFFGNIKAHLVISKESLPSTDLMEFLALVRLLSKVPSCFSFCSSAPWSEIT